MHWFMRTTLSSVWGMPRPGGRKGQGYGNCPCLSFYGPKIRISEWVRRQKMKQSQAQLSSDHETLQSLFGKHNYWKLLTPLSQLRLGYKGE